MFPSASERARFGPFEAHLRSGELFKYGIRIKIQDQPFQVLAALLERPGQLVSRDELRRRLWSDDTFVDFDAGLNAAVRRLRDSLCDSNGTPRFVETLPRRGYRFIASVEMVETADEPLQTTPEPRNGTQQPREGARVESRESVIPAALKNEWVFWRRVAAVVCALTLTAGAFVTARRLRLPTRGTDPKPIRSIAVVPLRNLSGDSSQDYFAEGITDALITNLAQIKSLRVISRTSVVPYANSGKSLSQIAGELNVDSVVEGAVVVSGDRVRIDARLNRAGDEQHLWAKSYDRRLSNILMLQNEVARDIASEIRAELSPLEKNRLAQVQSIDPEAYELYLRGRYCWNKRTDEGYDKAIEFFERAIAVQPGYAQAYAGLADAYALIGVLKQRGLSHAQTISLARSTALKALALDDTVAEAHASLASIAYVYDWDWPLAEKEFIRAIDLNPNYATAHHWYAYYLMSRGKMDESLAEIRLARQLDPQSLIINSDVGQLLYTARRYDEAIEVERRTLEMDATLPWPHRWMGLSYLAKRDFSEAIAELQTNARMANDEPGSLAILGMAYAQSDHPDEAKQILRQIRALPAERYDSMPDVAWLLASLDEKDQAFGWLERSYAARARGLKGLAVIPYLDDFRSDPRFQDLQRRVGLTP
jgi:TolB-like protein/DNA-binding winged helix-turn-helix (wHTH) protein/Tfp pilus assembly protein PilF